MTYRVEFPKTDGDGVHGSRKAADGSWTVFVFDPQHGGAVRNGVAVNDRLTVERELLTNLRTK